MLQKLHRFQRLHRLQFIRYFMLLHATSRNLSNLFKGNLGNLSDLCNFGNLYLIADDILKIGKYSARTTIRTIPPIKTISAGSKRAVKFCKVVSSSSS